MTQWDEAYWRLTHTDRLVAEGREREADIDEIRARVADRKHTPWMVFHIETAAVLIAALDQARGAAASLETEVAMWREPLTPNEVEAAMTVAELEGYGHALFDNRRERIARHTAGVGT